jgi:hypothetical protein
LCRLCVRLFLRPHCFDFRRRRCEELPRFFGVLREFFVAQCGFLLPPRGARVVLYSFLKVEGCFEAFVELETDTSLFAAGRSTFAFSRSVLLALGVGSRRVADGNPSASPEPAPWLNDRVENRRFCPGNLESTLLNPLQALMSAKTVACTARTINVGGVGLFTILRFSLINAVSSE